VRVSHQELDNCEHLLGACTQLVHILLTLPGIRILTTSREVLGIPGERRYPVAPMALPPAGLPLPEIEQYDAIRLFVERARAILPDFELTANNAVPIARLCRRLDGIPLAIELASARINVLSVAQIDSRLKKQIGLLGEATYITTGHHRTLRTAIDWSYDLLAPPEQALLRRLAVFAGGCSLSAVEAVCTGDGIERDQVLELLSSLVNKSLVVAETLQRTEARYSLLETIRQ
jgi:predicted ATPase